MNLEDIPDKLIELALVLVSVAILALPCIAYQEWQKNRLDEQLEGEIKYQSSELPTIQGNSLIGLYAPNILVFESLGTRWVTGYSSEISQTDSTPFITASGTKVRDGVIACPMYLEIGTWLFIDGDVYICEDRMKQTEPYMYYFDIWFATREEALEWGKQLKEIKKIQ